MLFQGFGFERMSQAAQAFKASQLEPERYYQAGKKTIFPLRF
jgi:hypothetical protein